MWRFALAVIYFLSASVTAQAIAPPAFDLDRHGLFGLGAQKYAKAWLFRSGVVSYAVITGGNLIYDLVVWRSPRPVAFLLLAGAVCFGLTALFAPPPLLARIPADAESARRHHVLLLTGMAFYVAAMLFTLTLHSRGLRIFFTLALLLLFALSVWLSRRDKKSKGLFETLAFVVCIIWPILLYPAYF